MVEFHDLLTPQHTVLGCMLRFPECVGELMLAVSAEDFLNERCRLTFSAICDIFRSGQSVGPIHVATILCRDCNTQDTKDWRKFLAGLMEVAVTAANAGEYAQLMREQSRVSQLRQLGETLQQTTDTESALELLTKANDILAAKSTIKILTMDEGFYDFMERHDQKPEVLPWSIDEINQQLFVEPGDFVVIGGYPSAGKTAFALGEAWHMAAQRRVGFFSLETSPGKLYDRLVANVVGLDFRKIKKSELEDDDYEILRMRHDLLKSRPLELIPFAGRSLDELRALTLSGRYDVIFIDYLQLLPAAGKSRYEVVTNISLSLHQMAQRYGVTIIGLSQLSRPEKKNEKQKQVAAPTMASFRESGQIEQDADVAMLLYIVNSEQYGGQRCLKIAKNKEGRTGRTYLDFEPLRQRFKKSLFDPRERPEPSNAPQEYQELPPGDGRDLPEQWQPQQLKIGDKPEEKPEKE